MVSRVFNPHPKPLPDGSVSTRPHEEGRVDTDLRRGFNRNLRDSDPLPSLWGKGLGDGGYEVRGKGRVDTDRRSPLQLPAWTG